jgi:hypothetical protein
MFITQFPKADFKIKKTTGVDYIFDPIRKSWIQLTNEEWVRQNFIAYLVQEGYPPSFIAVEKEIKLNGLKKRFDILVYDSDHKPWMLVECKAHDIVLGKQTFDQVLLYNMSVPVSYILITNGNVSMCWKKEGTGLAELERLPRWHAR